jgi:hypothetical protein
LIKRRRQKDGRAIITRAHLRRGLRMRRALALAGVADDQVIEQRHVEDVGRLRQPERESRTSGLGVGSPLGWLSLTSTHYGRASSVDLLFRQKETHGRLNGRLLSGFNAYSLHTVRYSRDPRRIRSEPFQKRVLPPELIQLIHHQQLVRECSSITRSTRLSSRSHGIQLACQRTTTSSSTDPTKRPAL